MKHSLLIAFATSFFALNSYAQTYVTEIPDEDHMSYFDLRGPVKEVRQYEYANHCKTIWQFDKEGRLVRYENYATPFAGNGGCVFSLTDRYRYAYDEDDGTMEILEAFNDVENLDDANDDKILTLFPTRARKDTFFDEATKEYGDSTYCYSKWYEKEGDPLQHYYGRRYDKYGNWIEDFIGTEDSYSYTDVIVREISYWPEIKENKVPEIMKEGGFDLDVTYGGYVMECNLWPLHNGYWLVLSHWCIEEEDLVTMLNSEGEEVPASMLYQDPFGGVKYPIVPDSCVSVGTRNYGGKRIKFYEKSKGNLSYEYTERPEINLHVLDADVETRRLLVRTDPRDLCWYDYDPERKEYVLHYESRHGWIDEIWTCANLLTTCP